jgi:transposase
MKALSTSQRNNILSLLDSGLSIRNIHARTGHGIGTISRLRSKCRSPLQKSLGGRPSKLSPANTRHAVHLIHTGKAENAAQITKPLADIINQPLSSKTVHRHLKKAGMKAVVKRKRPFLCKRHRKARLDWAIAHQDWTVEDWKVVVYSDETKINRFGSDGRTVTWKMVGENLTDRLVEGTVKHGGGSVMVWGCMMWEGAGYACKIDGRMDANLYCQILDEDLQASIEYYNKSQEDIIFQQDNDPKHKSKMAQNWFQDNGIKVLPWPAQSPDMNPIEHLWTYLKRKLKEYDHPPSGILELWERVEKEWNKIPAEECQKLIESMPRRVKAVVKAKGGYTKY